MTTRKDFGEIVERSRRAMRTPDGSTSCLLCGRGPLGPSDFLGVFLANGATQKRIGAPPGKHRRVLYLVCADCMLRPELPELVDQKILRELTIQ